jgi:hypothetical protein
MSFQVVSGKNRHFGQNRAHQVNRGQTMSTTVKNEFSSRFDQNRAHWVNTGQTMSTRIKNEFSGHFGQNHHFRSKPSPPGQYGSNHADWNKK